MFHVDGEVMAVASDWLEDPAINSITECFLGHFILQSTNILDRCIHIHPTYRIRRAFLESSFALLAGVRWSGWIVRHQVPVVNAASGE